MPIVQSNPFSLPVLNYGAWKHLSGREEATWALLRVLGVRANGPSDAQTSSRMGDRWKWAPQEDSTMGTCVMMPLRLGSSFFLGVFARRNLHETWAGNTVSPFFSVFITYCPVFNSRDLGIASDCVQPINSAQVLSICPQMQGATHISRNFGSVWV